MEHSQKIKKAINLGKQLVKDLERVGQDDTISQWMAHYISEQISAAETLKGREKTNAEAKCFATIIKLWEHRSALAREIRPFAKFEKIISTVESISPKTTAPYYHQLTRRNNKNENTDPVQELIEFVLLIDSATRFLIESALKDAIALAKDKTTMKYLENSHCLPRKPELKIVRFLAQAYGEDKAEKVRKMYKSELEERIRLLNAFVVLCQKLKKNYEGRIHKIR